MKRNFPRWQVDSLGEQYRRVSLQCFFAWWLGRSSEASTRIAEASEVFRKSGNRIYEGGIEGRRAVVLADRGDFERARNILMAASKLMQVEYSENSAGLELVGRLFELQRARLYLREGQKQPVEKMLAGMTPGPEKVMEIMKRWLPFGLHQLQGELVLAQGRLDDAINHFRNPPELPTPFMTFPEFVIAYNIYFPRDELARAYVQRGDLDSALTEYERITRFDPESKDRRLIYPCHHYELAKLYEKKGLREKAIGQYEKFLTIWKNTDSDRPEPKDARTRLAELKR